jgi:hypothetical protein
MKYRVSSKLPRFWLCHALPSCQSAARNGLLHFQMCRAPFNQQNAALNAHFYCFKLLCQFDLLNIMLLCVHYHAPGLVIYECAKKSQQEGSAVLQQLFCRSGAPVRVSMWRKHRLFLKSRRARVPKWREHRHHAEVRLSHIYMPVERAAPVLYLLNLQLRSSYLCIMYWFDFVKNLAGYDRRSRK